MRSLHNLCGPGETTGCLTHMKSMSTFVMMSAGAVGALWVTRNQAYAQDKNILPTDVEDAMSLYGPLVGQLSVGGVAGYATGYAFKKLGKVVLFTGGLSFVALQVLSHYGRYFPKASLTCMALDILHINWKHVESTLTNTVDVDKDGQVNDKDLEVILHQTLNFLTKNMGGAGAGFASGLVTALLKS